MPRRCPSTARWIEIERKECSTPPATDVACLPVMCQYCDDAPCCVTVCATGALTSLKVADDEMARIAAADGLEPLRPDFDTRPRVYYRYLWRHPMAFIAGTVSAERDGIVDCVSGARVTLLKDGVAIAEQTTDTFGDFKFDRLDADGGAV